MIAYKAELIEVLHMCFLCFPVNVQQAPVYSVNYSKATHQEQPCNPHSALHSTMRSSTTQQMYSSSWCNIAQPRSPTLHKQATNSNCSPVWICGVMPICLVCAMLNSATAAVLCRLLAGGAKHAIQQTLRKAVMLLRGLHIAMSYARSCSYCSY